MKKTLIFIALILSCISIGNAKAVELLITDSNGNALNTTTNKLDLGFNPTPKTISVWLTYSSAEQSAANNNGGLWRGGFIATPNNADIANIFPPSSSSIINPNNQWGAPSYQWDSDTDPRALFVQVSRAAGQVGLQLDNSLRFLVVQLVVSPGKSINSSGTDFIFNVPPEATFAYNGGATAFVPQPQAYSFTVVPEPTTYVLGVVASGMLGGVGYYRRKKLVKKA